MFTFPWQRNVPVHGVVDGREYVVEDGGEEVAGDDVLEVVDPGRQGERNHRLTATGNKPMSINLLFNLLHSSKATYTQINFHNNDAKTNRYQSINLLRSL